MAWKCFLLLLVNSAYYYSLLLLNVYFLLFLINAKQFCSGSAQVEKVAQMLTRGEMWSFEKENRNRIFNI